MKGKEKNIELWKHTFGDRNGADGARLLRMAPARDEAQTNVSDYGMGGRSMGTKI
jgi:hypothetical protein